MPYGPPPSPRQVDVPASLIDQPLAWALSLALAALLAFAAWRLRERPRRAAPLATAALTLGATAPAAGMLRTAVWGAYPTVDKQGSLQFYEWGVHMAWLDPASLADNPGVQLIGVHLGHLWVTAALDLLLPDFGAFGAQGLLWLWLALWACWAWLHDQCQRPCVSLALAVPFGLGLHLFRDINYYTIEKAAVFVLPLYALWWTRTLRGRRGAPLIAAGVVLLASALNLYSGLLLGAAAALASIGWFVGTPGGAIRREGVRRQAVHYGLTLLAVAPLVIAQASLMQEGSVGASPECFLWGRAALDDVTLWPPAWNRLEAWRACEPWAVLLALLGTWRRRDDPHTWLLLWIGGVCAAVSLGPEVIGLANPVYMGLWHLVPFFWRIAKPESFFFITWLAALTLAARGLPRRVDPITLGAVALLSWLLTVRTHPAYPGFSTFSQATLPEGWQDRLVRQPDCEAILREHNSTHESE